MNTYILNSLAIGSAILLAISVSVFAAEPVQNTPEDAAESTTLDYKFEQVVDYINAAFHTNVTSQSSGWAWGPSFLSTGTVYFIKSELYIPHERMEFQAWFSQIGSEYNKFTICRLATGQTEVSVSRTVKPLLVDTRKTEKRILRGIEEGIVIWSKQNEAEQSVPGYPPQGVGSPEP